MFENDIFFKIFSYQLNLSQLKNDFIFDFLNFIQSCLIKSKSAKPATNGTSKVKFVCYGSMTNWNLKNSTQKLTVERPVQESVVKFRPKKNESMINGGFLIRKTIAKSEIDKEDGSSQQSNAVRPKEKVLVKI
ncbi:hypothetical protein BpHYR1_000718 [Brachionus plicatilis]|uniref:Uncharacterized protein n=1 Tax=Brachionus plicatilis TaxID=10195 RepID=A0A3M7SBS2_BRAPC|nr:hypothetical protein BpHYR1_000718 [Brachionus plicatilis]